MATTAPKKVIVMTGGNIGIGFECAKLILSSLSNVHLVLGCRDSGRADRGVSKLKAVAAESNTVESKPLQLASFASVRRFAEDINASFPQGIHTLILNAGLMACSRQLTEDKYEMNMQVNHLSQFLLAQLLLPSLRTGHATWPDEPSSVIFVSSSLHKAGVGRGKDPNLTMENVDGALEFDGMLFYRNSKLCQATCMHLMAASLKDGPVTVNAICPGFVPTTDLKRESGLATRILMDNVISKVSAASTAAEGGARVFETIAKDRRAKNGVYYDKEGPGESSEESRDPAKQKLWWNWTCQAVGLDSLVQ
ncbi:Retinol dehydrogenase 13 [Mortierella polycephala]|uniref:Retinol dehydrogenase 13 n=1 Tax=Mortierella polycephala TaxID=41804 RepID=A0A9P6Q772_9FUNG|nr:Retinol dehydrogenase 13 [Mortierella polycephala]